MNHRNGGTSRGLVALLYIGGILAGAQVGKAIISLPLIRAELHIGLGIAGALLSVFATLGAAFGIAGGAVVCWIGARRSLLLGFAGLAAGNAFAVAVSDPALLLAARALEGAGFFGVVLATPSLLVRAADAKDRDIVMGIWSAYMPVGITLSLLLGPVLPALGWQALWIANAAAAGVLAIVMHVVLPRLDPSGAARPLPRRELVAVLNSRLCLLIACAFFAYSFHYFSLSFVLPLLFTSFLGYSLGTAGLVGAAAMAVSAIGHLASGPLLRAKVPIWAMIAAAFAVYAVAVVGIFSAGLPVPQVALLAALALGIGGLAPGGFYSAAPQVAPTAESLPTTIGLFQQASNLGQFAGPTVVGICIEHLGWRWEPIVAAPVAIVGIALALAIRKYLSPGVAATRAAADARA